ncbi:hypothetical protein BC629DRAFT_1592515 [Irpex lacteus]|nr:hypothetical protein BC629DRAFT_1592515 [Irpex lacteus]
MGGIYPTICLINHSCLPNTHNSWNTDAEHETIHAIRPIQAGEEITIAYDNFLPYNARREHLKKAFGFDCKCRTCSLGVAERKASDSRRMQIKSLDEAIGNPLRVAFRPEECLRDCYSLLQILREEFDGHIGSLGGRLCYDTFQICISHGDEARGSVLAERAYILRRICEGDDSFDTQSLKSLSTNPGKHASFAMLSKRWKLRKSQVTKGLDTEQFENLKWLFRL